jgi:ATP-dependent Clp protease ATP-binding subunit ClpB
VVHLEEIEKAHTDVFNVLLQILDDGRVTDAQGRTIDFKNTVIIMTSNIGSQYLFEGITSDGEIMPATRQRVMTELRTHFRPEFLNRIDEIVIFKPLTRVEIKKIVDLMLEATRSRLRDRGMRLEVSDEAKDLIVKRGYDPVYGARPLHRFIQRELETRIGRALIADELQAGSFVEVGVTNDELDVKILRAT